MNFNEFPWHDTRLLCITIRREYPGERDRVELQVEWPNYGDQAGIVTVQFDGCYCYRANMNFGIVTEETILEAFCLEGSELLQELVVKWSAIGVSLEKVKHYMFKTNSTNSLIEICASNFTVCK